MTKEVRHGREVETAYRRGYDQAVYFLLSRLISDYNKKKHAISFAERVARWRREAATLRNINSPPPTPLNKEITEILEHLGQ